MTFSPSILLPHQRTHRLQPQPRTTSFSHTHLQLTLLLWDVKWRAYFCLSLSLTYPSSLDSLIIRQLMMKSSTTMGYWRGSCLWLQHFPISSLLCVCSWSMLIRYQFQWQWHPKWLAVLQSCHEICFRCCFGLLWHTCDKNDICDKYFLHFLV